MFNTIESKIREFAKNDSRIRAVILNGSKANPKINADNLQDFDIFFIVENFYSFIQNKEWISFLGKPILQQIPSEMNLGNDVNEQKISFTFLTYFEDGNRIDLTIFPKDKFENHFDYDSLSIVWMDKDNLLKSITETSDIDYHIIKPTQREFFEVCNEFWWCVTNVAKGLKREEIIYAKDMMDSVVRPMFLQIIEWKIGFEQNFGVSIGKSGKFIKKYVDTKLYSSILNTYSDFDIENNWKSLLLMMNVFETTQYELAKNLNFINNTEEAENSTKIVMDIKNL